MLRNIHPGEILMEEFLKPLKISQNQLARSIMVSPRRINEIALQKRSITSNTSLRLAKYFGLSDDYFLGLQNDYDLENTRRKIESEISLIEPLGK